MSTLKVSTPGFRGRARFLTAGLALALLAGSAPSAYAQGSGVVFEPGSPSDKEYAIPLEEARRDAGGGTPGQTEAAAFGIGLSRRSATGRGSEQPDTGGTRGSRGGGTPEGARAPGGRGTTAPTDSSGIRDRLADAESAAAPVLWRVGPLLLVLMPALLVGLLLARRGRFRPPAAT